MSDAAIVSAARPKPATRWTGVFDITPGAASSTARRPAGGPVHPGLRVDENIGLQSGAWFGALSEPLRQAILSRARVRKVAAGTALAQRGETTANWIGVVRGALRLGTPLSDGRSFTLDFIGPGQWFGDIAVVDQGAHELDLIAHVPSTLLVVSSFDLRRLIDSCDELREALLQLNCARLRHMVRRFEELHTLALPQRLARELQRLARRFGRPLDDGVCIELALSQGDLAALVGGSRQRVNRALGQMQLLGILRLGASRLLLRHEGRLNAAADGRIALNDASPPRGRSDQA